MTYALLTAPEALTQPALATRYMVELASHKTELDAYGVEVPSSYRTIDVVVTQATEDAIKALIAATGWLEGYTMVQSWKTEDGTEF